MPPRQCPRNSKPRCATTSTRRARWPCCRELASEARRAEGPAAQAARKSALLAGGALLGLLQQDPATWFARDNAASGIDAAAVQALVDRRHAAKAARDFATADAIRAELTALGVLLEDTPQGPRWKVAPR